MNNKHLTFEERSIIEDLLNKGEKSIRLPKSLAGLTLLSFVKYKETDMFVIIPRHFAFTSGSKS